MVRMFRFLLGPEGFQRGVEAFFNNNDGKVRFLLALALHGLLLLLRSRDLCVALCPHYIPTCCDCVWGDALQGG